MPKDEETMTSCLLDIRYRESNLETGTIALVSVQEDSTISFGEVSITQHMKEKWYRAKRINVPRSQEEGSSLRFKIILQEVLSYLRVYILISWYKKTDD